MRLAGYCHRNDDEIASMLVLWQPDRGQANRGKRRTTLVDTLLDDTGCTTTGERQEDRDRWLTCLLYTSPSPRDKRQSRMPSSA